MTDTHSPFFAMSSDIMMVLDDRGLILAANRSAQQHLKQREDELVGFPIYDFVAEIARERIQTKLSFKQIGEPSTLILDFYNSRGQVLITKTSVCYDPISNRFSLACQPYVSVSEDENLRWRLALESSDAGFWAWEISSDIIYFSERLETMLGYKPGELPLSFATLRSLVHPDDVPENIRHVTPFLNRETADFKIECRARKKDGSYMWIQATAARTVDPRGNELATGWHIDIDDLKRTEERLLRSEERSQFLLRAIPDLLFVFDRSGRFVEVHTSRPESLIAPREELIGQQLTEVMPPAIAKIWSEKIAEAARTGLPQSGEYTLETPRGLEYFEARLLPRGETVVAIVRDITPRKVAEAAAATAEERFRSFLQNCPATVFTFVTTNDGLSRYTYVAGRVLEMYETTADELIGTPVFTDIAPTIIEEDRPGAAAILESVSESLLPFNWLGRFRLPSGRVIWVNTIGTPTRRADGSLQFNGISFDVTHEQELAQQVQEQQVLMSSSSRLTALGEMAGGIAHEINNPLTVAHAYASRLRDMAEAGKKLDPETVIKSAQKIESVCMRISRIIAGLRSIARDGDNDRFVLAPLKPIVEDALSLSTEKFRHRQIELTVDKIPDGLSIECRSVQISQVIVNLLLNAQHAVEVMTGLRWIRLGFIERASTVELRISDSGSGIAPEVRDRIFDPFFTTKEVGKGTGLGLSISASIAEAHGGALYLDENEPHTTFVLILQKRHHPGVRMTGDQ